MSDTFIRVQSAQKAKTRQRTRRTALSLFIGGLFCSAAPAWADCTVSGTPNANGGVDMTCKGIGITQDTNLLGNQSNNTVTVQGDGTIVYNELSGGSAFSSGIQPGDFTVARNSVTLNNNSFVGYGTVYGGRGAIYVLPDSTLTVKDNSVILNNNSSVGDSVYGGSGDGAAYGSGSLPVMVTGNVVTLNDSSSVGDSVYGGSGSGNSGNIIVTGNTVTLNQSSSVGDSVSGGSGSGSSGNIIVTGNTVTLNQSSSVGYFVSGGSGLLGDSSYSGNIIVTGNTVTLNQSSSVGVEVSGGNATNLGLGSTVSAGNTVTLNGSSVSNTITGGRAQSNHDASTVTGNIVTLNNSSAGNDVYGGYGSGYDNSVVTDNIVNINDTATVPGSLYGGFFSDFNGGVGNNIYDAFSGNTLNFAAAPITLSGEMANFENYNFTVDPALRNTDTALITAQTITFGTNETNMKGGDANTSKIKVVGIKAGNELFADDKFVLMQATGIMSGDAEGLTTNGVAQQGISLLYDVRTDVDTDGKLVTATIIGKEKPVDPEKPVEPGKPAARVNPQLKALSEGHLASAMMLTRGADTLAYNTVHTIQHQNPDKGLAPFITLSGDKTRYNSGSHIDAKDGRLTGGVSYQTEKLTSAVLIESGWGSYTTHNGFATMNDVNGDGHNRYTGAAVLGHYDFDSGMFAEASLRAGKNRNTFDTKDIVNLSTGEKAHYNLDSNYLGAHIGTGYSKALDEKNTADVSAKYLWTQLKGKDVKIAGDNIHFDDINSHRVRLDAGLSHKYTDAVALRAGLGYEYEFDGKAQASTYGYGIGAPSVQGSTAIMTVGATVTPMANQAFTVDVNASGYTGQRDGIGGNIKFSYAF